MNRSQINKVLVKLMSSDRQETIEAMLVMLFTHDVLINASAERKLFREPKLDEIESIKKSLAGTIGDVLIANNYVRFQQSEGLLRGVVTLIKKPETK